MRWFSAMIGMTYRPLLELDVRDLEMLVVGQLWPFWFIKKTSWTSHSEEITKLLVL